MPKEERFGTQTVDSFIDNKVHEPRSHESRHAANEYAKDLSGRRKGEVRVVDASLATVAIYENGVALTAN
jgi:hypothetical protein